jgi:hypothetical protein
MLCFLDYRVITGNQIRPICQRFIGVVAAVKLTEALATQRITVEDSRGNVECKEATGRTAANVRFAIDREMQDRQKRLLP